MGFEIHRFVDLNHSLAEDLMCSICLNVFDSAISGVAVDCDHTFCKQCVQQMIDKRRKSCPQCRKPFTSKRSFKWKNDKNLVLISNYVFKTNRILNNIISKLKVKCNYHSNGCNECIELALLQTHLKECGFKSCKTCKMPFGSVDDHNCIELLIKDRNKWKSVSTKTKDENSKLKEEMNKTKNISSKFEKTINKMKTKKTKLDEQNKRLIAANNQYLKLELNMCSYYFTTNEVYFGRHNSSDNWKISFGLNLVMTRTDSETLSIEYMSINEFMYCFEFSMLFIGVNTETCDQIRNQLNSEILMFDIRSENVKYRYISIELKPYWLEVVVLFANHFISKSKANVKCEAIDTLRAKQIIG